MTTEINVGVVEDVFEKNALVTLERSSFEKAITLSAADWIVNRLPLNTALIEVLRFVYSAICERLTGYHLWLLLGDSRWQNDTRIVRYMKVFNSLKAQGVNFEELKNRREFVVEQSGKLKFFGAVRLEKDSLELVMDLMQPGSCTYLLALPVEPALPESSGWSGRLGDDDQLIRPNVENNGVIFQRVGYFDDPEVGLVALGKPDVIARLTA